VSFQRIFTGFVMLLVISLGIGCDLALPEEAPIRSIELNVPVTAADQVEAKLRRLAKREGFRFVVSRYDIPHPNRRMIELGRKDMLVVAHNPFDARAFEVSFHKTRGRSAASDVEIDATVKQVSRELASIPGVTLSSQTMNPDKRRER